MKHLKNSGLISATAVLSLGLFFSPLAAAGKGPAKPQTQPKPPTSAAPPLPNTPYKTTPKTRGQVSQLHRKAVDAQSAKVQQAADQMNGIARTATSVKSRTGIDLLSQPQEGNVLTRAINKHASEVTQLKQIQETSLRDFAAQRNMRIVRKKPTKTDAEPKPNQLAPPPPPPAVSKSWRPPGTSEPRVVVRKTRF